MSWMPHVTVATIVEHQGRFLFVEEESQAMSHLVINQPAGHVEANETLIQAAVRETLEETAWHVEVTHLQGIYTYTPPSDLSMTYYRFCFRANLLREEVGRALDQGIHRALWLNLEELQNTGRSRSPLVLRCVEDALQEKKYPLDLIFEQPLFNPRPDLLNT